MLARLSRLPMHSRSLAAVMLVYTCMEGQLQHEL